MMMFLVPLDPLIDVRTKEMETKMDGSLVRPFLTTYVRTPLINKRGSKVTSKEM